MVTISTQFPVINDQREKLEEIFWAICTELVRADLKHPPMDGPEEGWGTLNCEVWELHREIIRRNRNPDSMRKEAIQCGTMSVKFLRDCCP